MSQSHSSHRPSFLLRPGEWALVAAIAIAIALTALVDYAHLPSDAAFQVFAVARCTGWIAHAMEQASTGMLIRPRARYVGPPPRTSQPA